VTTKGLFFAAVVAALAPAAGEGAPTCRTASAEVESVIAEKARDLSMTEYCQFRRYDALDDVDGDGKDDFLVLFTLEGPGGGNHHVSFLAFFPSAGGPPSVVQTGQRGERDPVGVRVEHGKVVLRTREYRTADPMCCPSGKGSLSYEWKDGSLRRAR
jgi:hypothetical protein